MMNHVNSVLLDGCLTGDPVSRPDPKGEPVCTFAMASNHFYKSEGGLARDVCFFGVEARGRLAEGLRDLGQGRGVRVFGRLRRDRWSGSDGEARVEVFIAAERVERRPELERERPAGVRPKAEGKK
jgi:single stranded DNA-binding protein